MGQAESRHDERSPACSCPDSKWTSRFTTGPEDDLTTTNCALGDKGRAIVFCGVEQKGDETRQSDIVEIRPCSDLDQTVFRVNRNDLNATIGNCWNATKKPNEGFFPSLMCSQWKEESDGSFGGGPSIEENQGVLDKSTWECVQSNWLNHQRN